MDSRKKIVLGAIGTIVLGALGSGVWVNIFEPFFKFSSEFVLNIISFGVISFKDNIYVEISRNLHESTGLELLGMAIAAFLSLVLFVSGLTLFENKFKQYVKRQVNGDGSKKRVLYKVFLIFYILFAVSFMYGSLMRTRYINRSISNYNQLRIIVTPYVSSEEYLKIESQFALIQTEADYISLMDHLKQIAFNNNLDVSHVPLD